MKKAFRFLSFLIIFLIGFTAFAQDIKWDKNGDTFYAVVKNEIFQHSLPNTVGEKLISSAQLSPKGQAPLSITDFAFSADGKKVLIYTNTKSVWRLQTQGDYWVYELATGKLTQVG